MYTSIVDNQDQALAHLFFHCCLEDNNFTPAEMDDLSAKLVILDLNGRINIKEELITYRSYRSDIPDEQLYIRYLLSLIKPRPRAGTLFLVRRALHRRPDPRRP